MSNVTNRLLLLLLIGILSACAGNEIGLNASDAQVPKYTIGPGDGLNVFVWGNPDLSTTVQVRPDGYVTTPLVEDLKASGKTSTAVAREMEAELRRFIKNPKVTVTITSFVGRYTEQIRVIGEAVTPKALAYRENMTVLDVIIAVGGLTEFASGNKTTLIRTKGGNKIQYTVRLDDLVKDGDMSANVIMMPGDVIVIPESWF